MNQMYDWVRDIFTPMWSEIEDLTGQEPGAEATVRHWFQRLLRRFEERGITLESTKNHVVAVRNEVRLLKPDHFCLPFITFESDQWTAINIPSEEALRERIQNQRLLPDPWGIIERTDQLLDSRDWPQMTVGLAVAIGRRISELLSANTVLTPCTEYSVLFRGQLKQRSDRADAPDPEFEIPTLVPAADVLATWERLRKIVGVQKLHPRQINNRYGPAANDAADQEFAELVPLREGKDRRYMHLYRAVYATLAVYLYCPVRINAYLFKAEIQGHRNRFESAGTAAQKVSVASQLHYDDYKVASEDGTNIDGRQGLMLGQPGVQILRVFQRPGNDAPLFPLPEPDVAGQAAPTDESFPEPAQEEVPAPDESEVLPTAPAEDQPATPPTMEAPETTPAAEPPADPAAATTPAPEPSAEKVSHPKPVTYRVYPEDAKRLNSFKLDPKESQAENLHRLLERAARGEAAVESLKKLETEHANVVAQLELSRANCTTLEGRIVKQNDLAATAVESDRKLHLDLAQARRDVRALAQTLLAAAQETSDDDHATRLTLLAGDILRWPLLRAGRVDDAAGVPAPTTPPPVEPAAPALPETKPTPEAASSTPAAPTPAPEPSGSPALEAAPATPKREVPPALQRLSLSRSQLAQNRIDRTVQAIIAHNKDEPNAERRFAITPKAIQRVSGCFRPAISKYLENPDHAKLIEDHNREYGLSKNSANWQGRKGIIITEVIKLPEASPEPEAPAHATEEIIIDESDEDDHDEDSTDEGPGEDEDEDRGGHPF